MNIRKISNEMYKEAERKQQEMQKNKEEAGWYILIPPVILMVITLTIGQYCAR